MDNKLFDSIPLDMRQSVIQKGLIEPIKLVLYRLSVQLRAAEITDDKVLLDAVGKDTKRLAQQLAIYEREFEAVQRQLAESTNHREGESP